MDFPQEVFAYPCVGTHTEECAETLREAVEMYGWYTHSELRLDLVNGDDSAWVVTPNYWISMTEHVDIHDGPTSPLCAAPLGGLRRSRLY